MIEDYIWIGWEKLQGRNTFGHQQNGLKDNKDRRLDEVGEAYLLLEDILSWFMHRGITIYNQQKNLYPTQVNDEYLGGEMIYD